MMPYYTFITSIKQHLSTQDGPSNSKENAHTSFTVEQPNPYNYCLVLFPSRETAKGSAFAAGDGTPNDVTLNPRPSASHIKDFFTKHGIGIS